MKITSTQNVFLAVIASIIAFSACNNSPYPGYDLSENGLYSKFYNQDENGVKPKEGDVARVIMRYSVVKGGKDTVLFDSKDPKFNREGTNYIEIQLTKSTFQGSYEDALSTMAVGDSASFKISADSVYLKTFRMPELPKHIEKGSVLTFETKLLKVISKEEVTAMQQKRMEEQKAQMELMKNEEMSKLEKYIADNKITAKPTESGLYYIEVKKGKGTTLKMGDVAKVNYTGRFIDSSIFDTSDEETAKKEGLYDERRPYGPVDFTVGQLVPGFNEALLKMSAGTKAKLIIPSSIGYGDGGGRFAPYATLIFDVEIGSVTPAAAPVK